MKTKLLFIASALLLFSIVSCDKDDDNTQEPPVNQKDYFEFKLDGTLHSFEFPTEEISGLYTSHPGGEKYTALTFFDNMVSKISASIGTTETNMGSYSIEDPDNGEIVTAIVITLLNGGNNPLSIESQTGTLKFTEFTQYENTVLGGGYVDAVGEFSGTFADEEGNTYTITEGRFRSKESKP
ncbi:MAG: hypothetical protein ACK5M1_08145 [Xanthomarina gelatinilytica]|uniref:hypothetical protein n=1 Tax=Xanthomarina gelatinilytica TaxID=1137281 RepID=UPI003A895A0F